MLLGTYPLPSQRLDYYFEKVSNALNMYMSKYDKILLTGDFNTNECHVAMKNSLELPYSIKFRLPFWPPQGAKIKGSELGTENRVGGFRVVSPILHHKYTGKVSI